jgi:TonB family protein
MSNVKAHQMNPRLFVTCVVLLSAGCASPRYYYSTYQVAGATTQLTAASAEEVHLAAVNSNALVADTPKFDTPIRLVRAPQPAMSREDTDARVIGRVVVEVVFGESGAVESTRILESTKESLSEAVIAAVSRWAIAPLTREGKPVKLVARQPFAFKTEP